MTSNYFFKLCSLMSTLIQATTKQSVSAFPGVAWESLIEGPKHSKDCYC